MSIVSFKSKFDIFECRACDLMSSLLQTQASSEYSAERQLNNLLFPRISGKQQKQKEAHQTEL